MINRIHVDTDYPGIWHEFMCADNIFFTHNDGVLKALYLRIAGIQNNNFRLIVG